MVATQNIDTLGPIFLYLLLKVNFFSQKQVPNFFVLAFVASGLDINGCVLSYFEGESKCTLLYKLYTHYFTL